MTHTHNVLIASGEYVSAEIAAEFGRIPPAFLPIGNRRLYFWQVREIKRALPDARIHLSLPEDFTPDAEDVDALAALGVTTLSSPLGISLGAALTYVILSEALVHGPLTTLHGDTLIKDYPYNQADAVSVGTTRAYYAWADYVDQGGKLRFAGPVPGSTDRNVLTGAFAFSDVPGLLRALAVSDNRFIDAVARYSDDHPLQCLSAGDWLDFGHLHTYFQSRRRMTTERHFNRIESDRAFLVKSSVNRRKIEAEAAWFTGLPDSLRPYVPLVCHAEAAPGHAAYRIEYHHLTTLNDLYVFGSLPLSVWGNIFEACSEFLATAAQAKPPELANIQSDDLYLGKTLQRLEELARNRRIDLDAEWVVNGQRTPSLKRVAEEVAGLLPPVTEDLAAIVHGDFCFSNIMFDFRSLRLKVIDPRGIDSRGNFSMFGDVRYETGKLHHSVVGLYDHIVAGRASASWEGDNHLSLRLPDTKALRDIQHLFMQSRFAGTTPPERQAGPISVMLFLSMLPLHADVPERQDALLANALRLFLELDQGIG